MLDSPVEKKRGRKSGYRKENAMKAFLAMRIPQHLENWLQEEGEKRGLGIGDMARMLLLERMSSKKIENGLFDAVYSNINNSEIIESTKKENNRISDPEGMKEVIALQILSGKDLEEEDMRYIIELLYNKPSKSTKIFSYKAIRKKGDKKGDQATETRHKSVLLAQEYIKLRETMSHNKAIGELSDVYHLSESRIKSLNKKGKDLFGEYCDLTIDKFLEENPDYRIKLIYPPRN